MTELALIKAKLKERVDIWRAKRLALENKRAMESAPRTQQDIDHVDYRGRDFNLRMAKATK